MENEQWRISGADEQFTSSATPLLRDEAARLIVLEGIDLSGRTTQVHLLRDWLSAQHYHVTTTAWRTSPLISDVLARARTKSPLRPLSYSLLYCADHLDRTERVIRPALERGEIVLADRYVYTAFARDEARGLDKQWVRNLYRFTLEPDAVFYLHISPEEAVRRRVALQQRVALEKRPEKRGEMKMYSQYQRMQKEFNFTVVEGGQSIDLVQATLRRAVLRLLLEAE
jgi:dTMP kinase